MPVKTEKKYELNLGDKISRLDLISTDGSFSIQKLLGKKVVFYFYPKDNTPGCTLEGQQFTALKKEFAKLNAVVYGISKDSLESHKKFKEKMKYSVDLISDQDGEWCNRFDVIHEKNMYGKKIKGLVRSTFVLDEKGVVIKVYRNVKADGHAQKVLEDLKAI